MTHKVCTGCAELRPLDAYSHDRRHSDGRQSRCRRCRRSEYAERGRGQRRARYQARRTEVLETANAYRRAHPEMYAKASREWRARHPERVTEVNRRYQPRKNVLARQYRARKAGADGVCTPEQWRARSAFYGDRCYMCGADAEAADHVIPLSGGGTNWPANLRPVCTSCNSRKGGA